MPTTVDVFAKAREHERGEILRAVRDADVVPYWRALDSAAGPVVEMEGAERVMLGSNNYLGRPATNASSAPRTMRWTGMAPG